MKQVEGQRLAELSVILFSSVTNSNPANSTPNESEMCSPCWRSTAGLLEEASLKRVTHHAHCIAVLDEYGDTD